MIDGIRRLTSTHPYLSVYILALAAVWVLTLATWTGDATMHPLAQILQYVVALLAAALAGYRVRVAADRDNGEAYFGFGEIRLRMANDVGGASFWTALLAGIVAMQVNVLLLIAFDVSAAALAGVHPMGPEAGPVTYLAWVGAGIAAGAVIGAFSAFLALAAAWLRRPRR